MPVRVGDLTGIPVVLYGRMIIVRARGPENDPLLRAMMWLADEEDIPDPMPA
jgi:hypothetical protein